MTPWTEKHRPESFLEIKGQDKAVTRIKSFIIDFTLGNLTKIKKKSLILHGPPGVGKTSLVYVAAKETNSEIFELNASDLRNKDKMQEVLKPAIQQKSLLKTNKIILVDEVDGISGYEDRGGVIELLKLIEESTYPVIITANDIWKKNLSALRQKSELISLKELDYKIIQDVLTQILKKENLSVNNDVITKIAINAKGDLRAAINDLQTASKTNFPETIIFDERNKEVDIFNALKQVFQSKPTGKTLEVFDSVNMNLDEIMLWLEENIYTEYSGEELARAYDLLSKADVFKGRIYKQQYWRFLVYENILLSYGISASKKEPKTGFTSYKKPTRILKIWMNNQKTIKKKSIAQKYSEYTHVGEKRAMREFPLLKNILQNPEIQKELKLSPEEIEYLEKPI